MAANECTMLRFLEQNAFKCSFNACRLSIYSRQMLSDGNTAATNHIILISFALLSVKNGILSLFKSAILLRQRAAYLPCVYPRVRLQARVLAYVRVFVRACQRTCECVCVLVTVMLERLQADVQYLLGRLLSKSQGL